MIGISFKKISYKNFLSVGESSIELDLEQSEKYLILGGNGQGKSTLIDAISYALFGKPYRKINKPKLINSINKKGLLVELEFDVGVNKYLIRRGMKPNIFEIYCNGKLLNQDSDTYDYQARLEKLILKLNPASARQTVLLSKTAYKPFMELDAKERRPFIEDLLNIEIYSIMAKLLSIKVSETKRRLADVSKDAQHVAEKIEIIRNNISRFVQNTEEMVSARKARIISLAKEGQSKLSEISDVTAQHAALQAEFQKDYEQAIQIKSEYQTKFSSASARRNALIKELQFFEHTNTCPTCAQEIDENYRHNTIEKSQAELDTLNAGISETELQIKSISDQIDSDVRPQQLNKLNATLISARTQIQNYKSTIKSLEEEIKQIQAHTGEYDKDHELVKELQKNSKKLIEEKKNLLEQSELYKISSYLLKDSGIKSVIIKQYIPVINKYINKYLASMDFYIEFELDENFNEVIKSRHRDEFSYNNFSEGEKFRIDLALMLTWRAIARMRNNCAASILFMDEIFDSSLDEIGIEDLLKLIDVLASEGTGVYVISHRGDRLIDKFENIIKFEKVRNFTQLVEE